mmetsp:Transcript_136061/g.239820  ORF Transcript_136061/g.239820 Transcript_136061/m.239820 type:complete len:130 (+) Transcript_136061:2-391(+)
MPWSTKQFLDALQNDEVTEVLVSADGERTFCKDKDGNLREPLVPPEDEAEVGRVLQQKGIELEVLPSEEFGDSLIGGLLGISGLLFTLALPLAILVSLSRALSGQKDGGMVDMGGRLGGMEVEEETIDD